VINVLLRLGGLLALAVGISAEVARAIPAAGLAVVLGASLAFYLWFLAIARRCSEPSQRRRQ
jgi:hypothetical protein